MPSDAANPVDTACQAHCSTSVAEQTTPAVSRERLPDTSDFPSHRLRRQIKVPWLDLLSWLLTSAEPCGGRQSRQQDSLVTPPAPFLFRSVLAAGTAAGLTAGLLIAEEQPRQLPNAAQFPGFLFFKRKSCQLGLTAREYRESHNLCRLYSCKRARQWYLHILPKASS